MRRGVLIFLVLFGLTVPLATGHPSPPGCTQPALSFDWGPGLNIIHRNGDVVPITAMVGNDQIPSGACDMTDASVTLTFPNPDGTPNGQEFVLATNVDFPANSPKQSFPTKNLTANFDPGVFRGFVSIGVSGIVHFSDDPETAGPIGGAGRPLGISRPHVTLTVTPDDPGPGSAPFPVTYTYTAENDSPADPAAPTTTPGLMLPEISDDVCADIDYVSGDTTISTPSIIDPGETWTFTCSTSLGSGPVTNHVTLTGGSTRDGRPWPATTAQTTVTVNGPDLAVAKSHTQTFTQGDSRRVYKILVTNVGNVASSGMATVKEDPPGALKPTALFGSGWNCTLSTLTCKRSGGLAPLASFAPITVRVDVKGTAPANVVNRAVLSPRAGENTNDDVARDTTAIVQVKCGSLDATIVGTQRANTIRGTSHRDVIAALGGNDVVSGLGGNDLVCGGSGGDTLNGGSGKDVLRGEGGNDRLVGGPGRDTLLGGPGRDSLQQ